MIEGSWVAVNGANREGSWRNTWDEKEGGSAVWALPDVDDLPFADWVTPRLTTIRTPSPT